MSSTLPTRIESDARDPIDVWLEKNTAGRIRTGVVWADQPETRSLWPSVETRLAVYIGVAAALVLIIVETLS